MRPSPRALAVLTVHHWADRVRGLTELARGRAASVGDRHLGPCDLGFWLVEDYFRRSRRSIGEILPPMEELRQTLGNIEYVLSRTLRLHRWLLGRTGVGHMRIWTLAFVAPSPHSPRSAMWNLALGAYVATSQTAPGNVAMAISCAGRVGSGLPTGHCAPHLIGGNLSHSTADIQHAFVLG
jgi:hypothetical protein